MFRRVLESFTESADEARPPRRSYPVRRAARFEAYLDPSEKDKLIELAGTSVRARAITRILIRRFARGVVLIEPEELEQHSGRKRTWTQRWEALISAALLDEFLQASGATSRRTGPARAALRALISRFNRGQVRVSADEIALELKRAARRTRSR